MPRGRQPLGEHALSNAERQARYRARHQANQPPPVIHYRRPRDKRSRAQRWHDAVAELLALQAEYTAWHETLPETLASTATAEALQAIVELDLEHSQTSSRRAVMAAIDTTLAQPRLNRIVLLTANKPRQVSSR